MYDLSAWQHRSVNRTCILTLDVEFDWNGGFFNNKLLRWIGLKFIHQSALNRVSEYTYGSCFDTVGAPNPIDK